jgi:hypothetical protein
MAGVARIERFAVTLRTGDGEGREAVRRRRYPVFIMWGIILLESGVVAHVWEYA